MLSSKVKVPKPKKPSLGRKVGAPKPPSIKSPKNIVHDVLRKYL